MYVLSIVVCPFVLFLLAKVLSVLLGYTVSDCPFGIFKLFLQFLNNEFIIKTKVFPHQAYVTFADFDDPV